MGTVDVDDDVQLIGELASGGLVNLLRVAQLHRAGQLPAHRGQRARGGAVYDNARPDTSPSASATPGAPGRPGATSPRGASTA